VLVVDDDPAINQLIVMTLSEHGFETRSAADGHGALRAIRHETPDVVLLDVYLPDVSGYQLCRHVRDDYGDSVGIMLVSAERRDPFDRTAGLLIGADDYLIKPFAIDELIARVRRLAQRRRSTARGVTAQLTPRETEILSALSRGLDHHAIAGELVIAPKTVEKHIEHILLKLGVHSRAQAIVLALREEAPAPPVLTDVTHLEDVKRREALSG
jgi:DNA-binding NarL/FixJ family response regulator